MIEVSYGSESDIRPDNYSIENIIDGKCDIVLHDNIEEKTRDEEETVTYFTYNTYRIVQHTYRDNLDNILSTQEGFEMWLDYAKEQYDNQAEDVPNEERISTLEAVVAEILGGEV